jgi:hypothetical protein
VGQATKEKATPIYLFVLMVNKLCGKFQESKEEIVFEGKVEDFMKINNKYCYILYDMAYKFTRIGQLVF